MDDAGVFTQEIKTMRMILKFDTGADGFLAMIYVLVATAGIVLILGIYFVAFMR